MKNAYFFDPKSPLVFRTGRPFDQAGDPQTLAFPLPSTLAGACRTAWGDQRDVDFSDRQAREELLKRVGYGPLAASITDNQVEPLFPRPADALYLKNADQSGIHRLLPNDIEAQQYCDLPDGLRPVYLEHDIKSKPVPGDSWWTQAHMETWLLGKTPAVAVDQLGWRGPAIDYRTHVALEPCSLAADDGKLFQTQGLDFAAPKKTQTAHHGWQDIRYGLLAHMPESTIKNTCRRVGGEGRITAIQALENAWPSISNVLAVALEGSHFIRLILVTPALFEAGWRPAWINASTLQGSPPAHDNITLKLCAFANQRWEALSGWDLAEHKPRAVRRMVPAGSVYWFEVLEGQQHIADLWLQPVSDATQDRTDGFGLVLPGIWETTA
jgi:CRISPR-associated protein Cmr3